MNTLVCVWFVCVCVYVCVHARVSNVGEALPVRKDVCVCIYIYIYIYIYTHTHKHAGFDRLLQSLPHLQPSQIPESLRPLLHKQDQSAHTQDTNTARFNSPEPHNPNTRQHETDGDDDSYAQAQGTPRSVRVLREYKRSKGSQGQVEEVGIMRDVRQLQRVLFKDADGRSERPEKWTQTRTLIPIGDIAINHPFGVPNDADADSSNMQEAPESSLLDGGGKQGVRVTADASGEDAAA